MIYLSFTLDFIEKNQQFVAVRSRKPVKDVLDRQHRPRIAEGCKAIIEALEQANEARLEDHVLCSM